MFIKENTVNNAPSVGLKKKKAKNARTENANAKTPNPNKAYISIKRKSKKKKKLQIKALSVFHLRNINGTNIYCIPKKDR